MLRKKSRRSSSQEDSAHSVSGEGAAVENSEPPAADNIEPEKEESVPEAGDIATNEAVSVATNEAVSVATNEAVSVATTEVVSEDKGSAPVEESVDVEMIDVETVETGTDRSYVDESMADVPKDDVPEEIPAKSPKPEQEEEVAQEESEQTVVENNQVAVKDEPKEEVEANENLNPPISGTDAVDIETSAENAEEKKQDIGLSNENILETAAEDLKSRIDLAVEMAHRVMETITAEDSKEEKEVIVVSDSDSDGKAGDAKKSDKLPEKRSVKRRIIRKTCDYTVRTRKNRINQSYMKRRIKRGLAKSLQSGKGKRRKQPRPKSEYFEDPTFDFTYFSELPENEKASYLALKYVTIEDDVEGAFKRGSYKIYFVQNCDLYVYRKDSLSKARESHQAISEIKTSNFNAWHRIWLDRYVTPAMVKFCNDWYLKSDPEKFRVVRQTLSDCTRPPYIPYYKYKIRYYKVPT